MLNKETIAAISTGMSNSGIGIVRISGDDAFQIIDRIYKGKKKLSEADSHTIHYGFIKDGDETVDEVLVSVMRAPRTFTGEDTVEINCHGGVYVVQRVLEKLKKRCETGRTGRIYQACVLKRKDGSFSGGSGDRCDHVQE